MVPARSPRAAPRLVAARPGSRRRAIAARWPGSHRRVGGPVVRSGSCPGPASPSGQPLRRDAHQPAAGVGAREPAEHRTQRDRADQGRARERQGGRDAGNAAEEGAHDAGHDLCDLARPDGHELCGIIVPPPPADDLRKQPDRAGRHEEDPETGQPQPGRDLPGSAADLPRADLLDSAPVAVEPGRRRKDHQDHRHEAHGADA